MRDGTPPRGPQSSRGSGEYPPGRRHDRTPPPPAYPAYPTSRGPTPNARPNNPYRPYGEPSNPRLPAPYQRGTLGTFNRLPAAGLSSSERFGESATRYFAETDDASDAGPHHRRLGFAIFHDGNPGHLWRGSLASTLGEGMLSVGAIMWLATLTLSPQVIALAVAALGVPFVLAGPLAARFESVAEPTGLLRWIGRLRIVLALALIAMHFRTILPVVYLLLFAISFCGRLHDALRVAVIRTRLARGEMEQVANDMHIGSALAAVLGPLLATFCYIVLGERILLVALAAAAFFLISYNSEGFLDTLPPNRRDFLLVTPETATSGDDWPDTLPPDDAAFDDDPEERREHSLPAWYQLGASTASRAIGDIRHGLALAGATQASAVALWALAALSLVGGGLAALEVFYLLQSLGLPPFYLGPLLAAEGAGLALGAQLAGPTHSERPWRIQFLAGLAGSGVALVALARVPSLPLALAACFALGICNALAVQGARQGLLDGFNGVEQRAIAAAESAIVALCAVLGALTIAALYSGSALPIHIPFPLVAWPAADLIFMAGIGLAVATVVFVVLLGPKRQRAAEEAVDSGAADSARLPALDDEDEDDGGYPPMTGEHDAWAESDERDWTGAARATGDYAASYGYQGTGYDPAAGASRGGYDDDDGDGDAGDGYDDDEYDDRPSGRRGSPARRPPPGNRRPRW